MCACFSTQVVYNLAAAYKQLPWYKKLFFPWRLASELNSVKKKMNDADLLRIFIAFENNTWFFQKWFFNSLKTFGENPSVQIFAFFHRAHFFSGEAAQINFNAMRQIRDSERLLKALNELFFDDIDITVGLESAYFIKALNVLSRLDLLTGDQAKINFDAMIQHNNLSEFVDALNTLDALGFLTCDTSQIMFDLLIQKQHPIPFVEVLNTFHQAGLFDDDKARGYCDAVVNHPDPKGFARLIVILYRAGLLTGDKAQINYYDAVNHKDLTGLIRSLEKCKNLTQYDFNRIIKPAAIDPKNQTFTSMLWGLFFSSQEEQKEQEEESSLYEIILDKLDIFSI